MDKAHELARISVEVAADGEIAEIAQRAGREDGPALLFENIAARSLPVAVNCLRSDRRVCLALGTDSLEQIGQRLVGGESSEGSWLKRFAAGLLAADITAFAPRVVKTAACQQVVQLGRDVDFSKFPVPRCGIDETATITAGYAVSTDATGSERSLTKVDLPIVDRNRLAVSWQPHEPLARHFASFERKGKKMPLAVVLGGPPSTLLASYAACPNEVDAFLLASVLGDAPVDLATCRTHALQVPAEAEFVFEGYVDPHEPPVEVDRFATSDGCLAVRSTARVLEVVQITQQRDAVFPVMVHAAPPNEETVIAHSVERILLPLWRQSIPELVDFHRPEYSAWRQIAFVSMAKSYANQGRKVASALRGHVGTMSNKLLILVDDDVDLRNEREVWQSVARQSDMGRDLLLDEASPAPALTIDATKKLPGERPQSSPQQMSVAEEIQQMVNERWTQYGLS